MPFKKWISFQGCISQWSLRLSASCMDWDISPIVLGYNERCNQKYVFYYHLHELLKWLEQCPLFSPLSIPPTRLAGGRPREAAAATLQKATSTNGPSRSPRITHRITPSHCAMARPGGGTKCSYLYVIWSLEPHDNTTNRVLAEKSWNHHWTSRVGPGLSTGSPLQQDCIHHSN